jgi:hypothetical protein
VSELDNAILTIVELQHMFLARGDTPWILRWRRSLDLFARDDGDRRRLLCGLRG